MSKLIKKINPNEYLKLTSYAIKYGVTERKVYRYVDDDLVDNLKIDGVPFIKDIHFPILERDNRESNVKTLTIGTSNVKTLTIDNTELPDNQLDNPNVNNLTIGNSIVNNLTLTKEEKLLLEKPEIECTIADHEKIIEIKKKM